MEILFTVILVSILVYYLIKMLFPVILRAFFKRINNNLYTQNKRNTNYKKGNTTITSNQKTESEVPKDLGEYTDFEEIYNE